MEIIPILAFVVLVATVATFIFAISAYILFKIRESKGNLEKAAPPLAYQVEIVAPESVIGSRTPKDMAQKYYNSENDEGQKAMAKSQKMVEVEHSDSQRFIRYTPKNNASSSKS